ncbi:ubiquitin-related domain-containing protein [Epithele typhae]|uniref:ubiquitin-related domain-containing protein n=1 Tax=Epithele typhae TaxID=378194 RepID=UPI0020088499|nr:ubiquitin-related domain-containing protein [Epithele typhae]KAH9918723.1 ubiquitin-related domain-containing protein [Epithele typhae]
MSDPRPPSPTRNPPAPATPNPDPLQPPHPHVPSPATLEHALHARIDPFSPLCPSARTSYTRVDFTGGTGANTPRPDFTGDIDGDMEEEPQPVTEDSIPQMPQVSITFLLVSGRRRTMSFEPGTTVGRVKELVWNAWPNDWQDERPPAPSYLRILYLGKILQDEDSLDKLSFPTQLPSATQASTIVHLSIRAYAPPSEEAPKKKRRAGQASSGTPGEPAEEHAGGCCACVIC